MAIDQDLLFIAVEAGFEAYNKQSLLNFVITVNNSDDTPFPFPGYVSSYLNVYQSRDGSQLKGYSNQITRNSNNLVFNCSVSDMTFADNGKYYYELGFIQSGGYPVLLRYGVLIIK